MQTQEHKKKKGKVWQRVPIRFKLGFAFGMMLLITGLMLLATLSQSRITMQETYRQETEYYNINSFQNTLLDADEQLQSYLRSPTEGEEYLEQWQTDARAMQGQIDAFDRTLSRVGEERYLLARGIQNGFGPYLENCETLFAMGRQGSAPAQMYAQYEKLEKITGYLQQYARQLQSQSLSAGQRALAEMRVRSTQLNNAVILGVVLGGLVLSALLLDLVRNIVTPVLKLSEESKAIGAGHFDTPDVEVENRDEIYTLVRAFNHMKHNTRRLVETLREHSEMEQALHQKELEASESRRLMEQAKMQQLRSQINPHFLFNTLNIISRTARREHATVSEKLILALARLFRYNLKTDAAEVPLQREINIVNDYMAIQSARFSGRVTLDWRIAPGLAAESLLVPAFLLQPIVENSIIHGLGPKVEGGRVRVRLHVQNEKLHVIVSDNGVGMDAATLTGLLSQQAVRGDVSGIGVGNVRSRVQMIDPEAKFSIHSRPERGTCVHIVLKEHRMESEAEA